MVRKGRAAPSRAVRAVSAVRRGPATKECTKGVLALVDPRTPDEQPPCFVVLRCERREGREK